MPKKYYLSSFEKQSESISAVLEYGLFAYARSLCVWVKILNLLILKSV